MHRKKGEKIRALATDDKWLFTYGADNSTENFSRQFIFRMNTLCTTLSQKIFLGNFFFKKSFTTVGTRDFAWETRKTSWRKEFLAR